MYDIYSNARNDRLRFALGKSGVRKLLAIGLNPSTATKEKSDTTVAKVEGTACRYGFDGFVMLNLYPMRSTDYRALPGNVDSRVFLENLSRIEAFAAAESKPVIWAAWGVHIQARGYLTEACVQLVTRLEKYGTSWRHFGALTKSGHPRHPSRLNYDWSFANFSVKNYIRTLDA